LQFTLTSRKAPIIPKSKTALFKSRTYPTSKSHTEFTASKKDKRTIKSSIFRSKIEKTSAKLPKKRRRPSKKLVTTLESLAAALPDIAVSGPSNDKALGTQSSMVSLKSKPGARKKKDRLEKEERLRFGKNMAVMARMATTPGGQDDATTGNRWTALRQHIVKSMGIKGDGDAE
jgi:hypothetical protein